jgi:hypothetical protein
MSAGLLELLQRDHDDITRALDTLVATTTPASALRDAVYGLRLAAAVHTVAEARTLRTMARLQPLPFIHQFATTTQRDHVYQQVLLGRMRELQVGTPRWYECALELREETLDHIFRADRLGHVLVECISVRMQPIFAATYAADRMRVLSTAWPAKLVAEVYASVV